MVDKLVEQLSNGMHKINVKRSGTAREFKESIDRGFTLVKFTETQGGTELGVRLDLARSKIMDADFEAATGTVCLIGTLVLNYNLVEMFFEVDLETLEGEGCLKLLADEVAYRAQRGEATSATAH